jgi:hypothetical protein
MLEYWTANLCLISAIGIIRRSGECGSRSRPDPEAARKNPLAVGKVGI